MSSDRDNPTDGFDFYILSSAAMTKKKSSRKSFAASAKEGTIYPPSGHVSCQLPLDLLEQERRVPDRRKSRYTWQRAAGPECPASEDDDIDTPLKTHSVLTLGGAARNMSDKLWHDSSRPVVSSFSVYDGDLRADDASYQPNITGAELPGLDYPGMVCVWQDKKLVVWGGEITWSKGGGVLQKSKDLFEIKCSNSRGKLSLDVTKYGEPGKMALSRQNRPPTLQKGNIPQGRSGHTFERVGSSSTALMFGGAYLGPVRTRGTAFLPPKEECRDCSLYSLELNTYTWTDCGALEGIEPRCYHSSCFTKSMNPNGTIIMVGGLVFGGDFVTRNPVTTVDMIHINNLESKKFSTQSCSFDVPPTNERYISMAASVCVDDRLYLYGGRTQRECTVTTPGEIEKGNIMYVYDLGSKMVSVKTTDRKLMPSLATTGATMLALEADFLLILGGCSQQYSAFTSKEVECVRCDLDNCLLNEQNTEERISWVQCSEHSCMKWCHLICCGLQEQPGEDEHFKCPACQ